MKNALLFALLAVVGAVLLYLLLFRGRESAPEPIETETVMPGRTAAPVSTPPGIVRVDQVPLNPSEMKPGEVRPGSRPDTILVQPLQPGPPKEIRRSYRVATHEEDPRVDRTDDGRLVFNQPIALAAQLNDPDHAPENDVQILDGILSYYRMIYRANPVGENFEVMHALRGNNQNKVVVFPDEHPAINAEGELEDRWGNPYFFHAMTRDTMDVVSRGPDGELGTIDDVKLGIEAPELQLNADLE